MNKEKEYLVSFEINSQTIQGVGLNVTSKLIIIYQENQVSKYDLVDFHLLSQAWHSSYINAETILPVALFHPNFGDRYEYALRSFPILGISKLDGHIYSIMDYFPPEYKKRSVVPLEDNGTPHRIKQSCYYRRTRPYLTAPEALEAVRTIYSEGTVNPEHIAAVLNDRGHRKPNSHKWTASNVEKMIALSFK